MTIREVARAVWNEGLGLSSLAEAEELVRAGTLREWPHTATDLPGSVPGRCNAIRSTEVSPVRDGLNARSSRSLGSAPLQIRQHLLGRLACLGVQILLGHHVSRRVPLHVQELAGPDVHRERCPPVVAVHDLPGGDAIPSPSRERPWSGWGPCRRHGLQEGFLVLEQGHHVAGWVVLVRGHGEVAADLSLSRTSGSASQTPTAFCCASVSVVSQMELSSSPSALSGAGSRGLFGGRLRGCGRGLFGRGTRRCQNGQRDHGPHTQLRTHCCSSSVTGGIRR